MALMRLLHGAARAWWQIAKPLSIGVRVLLVRDGKVALVHHLQGKRWHLPGGAVEKGESLEEALRREAREEAGAELGELDMFGAYSSQAEGKSDHVVVFICGDFSLGEPDGIEVDDVREYPLGRLPENASAGTRRRIEEHLSGGGPHHGDW